MSCDGESAASGGGEQERRRRLASEPAACKGIFGGRATAYARRYPSSRSTRVLQVAARRHVHGRTVPPRADVPLRSRFLGVLGEEVGRDRVREPRRSSQERNGISSKAARRSFSDDGSDTNRSPFLSSCRSHLSPQIQIWSWNLTPAGASPRVAPSLRVQTSETPARSRRNTSFTQVSRTLWQAPGALLPLLNAERERALAREEVLHRLAGRERVT